MAARDDAKISRRGNTRIHSEDTLQRISQGSKKESIIRLKLLDPGRSLAQIAVSIPCNGSYARRVWSRFVKRQVTLRGGPSTPYFPVDVHSWFYWNMVPPDWVAKCPIRPSQNRNGQRTWHSDKVSLVLHKSGQVFVYPYFEGWDQDARRFLSGFWRDQELSLFFESLQEHGTKEIAFSSPGSPKNFKLTIKGLGTLKTDRTPYPGGTTEFSFDPKLEPRLQKMDTQIRGVMQEVLTLQGMGRDLGLISDTMAVFGEAMKQHMALIRQLQDVAKGTNAVVDRLERILLGLEKKT